MSPITLSGPAMVAMNRKDLIKKGAFDLTLVCVFYEVFSRQFLCKIVCYLVLIDYVVGN